MRKISVIKCHGLYGRLDYSIDFSASESSHFNILYGDNGSGKTTILRLVYALLSPVEGEGNRSFIAKVPFRNLQVKFSDNSSITIDRTTDLLGGFTIITSSANFDIKSFEVNADKDLDIVDDNNPNLPALMQELSALAVSISLITDDRSIFSTESAFRQTDGENGSVRPRYYNWVHIDSAQAQSPQIFERKKKFNIKELYERANLEIKDQVIASSFSAQDSINQIYLEIAQRLAEAEVLRASKNTSTTKFISKLSQFEIYYTKYGKYGLIPNIDPIKLRDAVQRAPQKRKNAISEALSTLVENAIVRSNKLGPLLSNIDTFLTEVNRFFVGKKLSYNARGGFHIVDSTNVAIEWTWLSSGERQLVFLFGVVFLSLGKESIILIDEPEISLNIKWQRIFIDAVERIAGQTSGQFIIASHSMEVVAGHLENVSELRSLETDNA